MEKLIALGPVLMLLCWIWYGRRQRDSYVLLLAETVDAFRLGDGQEGEILFTKLQARLSGVKERLRSAERLMDARAYEHALTLISKVLEQKPDLAKAQRLRVRLYAKLVHPEALVTLRAWMRDHPEDDSLALDFGQLLLRLRHHEEAVQVLGGLVARMPEDARVHSVLGRVLFYAGRYKLAQEHLETGLRLRQKLRRKSLVMYDGTLESGYDFGHAVEDKWEEEQDRLLILQIEEGVADASIALHEETQADDVSQEELNVQEARLDARRGGSV